MPKNIPPALLRVLTGTMPIAARIDILKLRYFWKLTLANNDNPAYSLLKYKRNNYHEPKVGFVHEVFKICCKHNCLDVWLGISRPKENPMNTIRKVVEHSYLKDDLLKIQTSQCMYVSLLFKMNAKRSEKYVFENFFTNIGLFPDILGRRYFIYALLDECKYERVCRNCGGYYCDIIQHTLSECSKVSHPRMLLISKLMFYNIPNNVSVKNKRQLFNLALFGKRVFRNIMCEYLIGIGDYS